MSAENVTPEMLRQGQIAIAKQFESVSSSIWNTTPPPQDGTVIVAVGRVIWKDEYSTCVEPFVTDLVWEKSGCGYEAGITRARSISGCPFPKGNAQ